MKLNPIMTKTCKLAALALMPAAVLVLSGCWTSPAVISAPTGSPSLVGATILVESFKSPIAVQSVNPSQRKVVLQRKDGTTVTCKVGPQVANFNQVRPGDGSKPPLWTSTASSW